MKFSCQRADLNEAVSTALRAVSAKSTIPALDGLLIRAGQDLKIIGYNLEIGIISTAPANISEEGAAIFNARLLSDILKKLPEAEVLISVDDENRISLKCGFSSFDLTSMDPGEYPELPVFESEQSFEMDGEILRDMISKTVFSASLSEARPILTGVLFDIRDGKIRLVATDNFRFAVCTREMEQASGQEFSFIVPANTLREIERIIRDGDEKIKLSLAKKHILAELGGTVVVSRLLEGQFFKYENSLSLTTKNRITVSTEDFTQSIERVTPVINEKLRNAIKFRFEDGAVQISYISSVARAYDECRYSGVCETMDIGLSNRFILDALRAVEDEKIALEFSSPMTPFIIKPLEGEAFFYMIAPARI